jgi:hypothetical protein
MKCSVYIRDMKIAECELAPSDDSMCVAHAQLFTAFDALEFANLLRNNGAKENDGILDLLKAHGLRVMDSNGMLIPSAGSVIMFCAELNRSELDVYGIDAEYYNSRFHGIASDS